MNRLARFAFRAVIWISAGVGASVLIASGVGAQTMTPPPGMILIDCPVRPAPWQAPGLQGHAGHDLNLDPSSAYALARGVPEQCIAYPGGSKDVYHRIIGLKAYIPRWGNDPGSQTGALSTAVAIRDNQSGTWNTTEQEFWGTGQDWRNYVSDDGRWVYSVRGGLNTQTCDVTSQPDWRRWPVMVTERDLVGCLDRIWERGGRLGMPSERAAVAATNTVTNVPATSTPLAPPASPSAIATPSTEERLTVLERQQAEMLQLLRQLQATPTVGVQP